MTKKIYNDPFDSQYSHLSSVIYNAPNSKNFGIKPAFHKQTVQNPLTNHLASKMTISSIPSIYNKKTNNSFGFRLKQNRILFIRKIYFGVLLQLVLVVSLQCITKYVPRFKDDYSSNSYFYWIPLLSTILSLIILACCEFHRKYPYNYIAIIYFTCSAAVFLMHVATKFEDDIIFFTIIIFTASIIGLFIFTYQRKLKYTIYTGLGIVLIHDVITFILLFISNNQLWVTYLYSQILANIFLLFFVVDIQIMISGNHKHEIKDSEYVFATMTLYTDIVNLFIYILQLLNSAKD